MFRGVLFRKVLEQKYYRSSIFQFYRVFNIRIIISILLLSCLFLAVKIQRKRVYFEQYAYVFGKETIVETRSSRLHNITVAQSGPLRMMRFDMSSVEGVIHIDNPYTILLDHMRLHVLCFLWNYQPERVLFIGLGAGILPKIFIHLSPNTLIDIVEIDSNVIDLARKYFGFHENNGIRVHAADGRHFIERQPSNQYDFIIIDVFTNNYMPHELRTIECLGEYMRILKANGLVFIGFPYEQESRYRETFARALFHHTYRGMAKSSFVLIGLNRQARILDKNDIVSKAKSFQQSQFLPYINWLDEIGKLHDGTNDKWNKSANIFSDSIHETRFDETEKKLSYNLE